MERLSLFKDDTLGILKNGLSKSVERLSKIEEITEKKLASKWSIKKSKMMIKQNIVSPTVEISKETIHSKESYRTNIREYSLKKKKIHAERPDIYDSLTYVKYEFVSDILIDSDVKQTIIYDTKNVCDLNQKTPTYSISSLSEQKTKEIFMAAVIANDLETLEYSQKNNPAISSPSSPSKQTKQVSETQLQEGIECIKKILNVPKDKEKEWKNAAYQVYNYEFKLLVKIHNIQLSGVVTNMNSDFICKVGFIPQEIAKDRKFNFEAKGQNIHTTEKLSSTQGLNVNKEFCFSFKGKSDCLVVEIWGVDDTETMKGDKLANIKKKKKDRKQNDFLLGRCLVPLEPHMKEIDYQLYSLQQATNKPISGGALRLSLRIVAEGKLNEESNLNIEQKYELYKDMVREITYHNSKNGLPVSLGNMCYPIEPLRKKISSIFEIDSFLENVASCSFANLWIDSDMIEVEQIEALFIILNSEWEKQSHYLSEEQRETIISEILHVYEEEMLTLESLLLRYPPYILKSSERVNKIISIVVRGSNFLEQRCSKLVGRVFKDEIKAKLVNGINEWYIISESIVTFHQNNVQKRLESLIALCQKIYHVLESAETNYKKAFSIAKINFIVLFLESIDNSFSEEINNTLYHVEEEDKTEDIDCTIEKLKFSLFSLYLELTKIVEKYETQQLSHQNNKLKILNFKKWFIRYLNVWQNIVKKHCISNVDVAINIEDKEALIDFKGRYKVTSSVIDLTSCLIPNCIFNERLGKLPDIEDRIYATIPSIQIIIDVVLRYKFIMSERILRLTKVKSEYFELTREICIPLNNSNLAKQILEDMTNQILTEPIKRELEEVKTDNSVQLLVTTGMETIDKGNIASINAICKKITFVTQKFYENFLEYANNDIPIEQAINKLMNFLLRNVKTCLEHLNPELFIEFLEYLCRHTIRCISEFKGNKEANSRPKLVLDSLAIIQDFFMNEEEGVAKEVISGSEFDDIVDHFSLLLKETSILVRCYGLEMAKLCNNDEYNLGNCTYSVIYNTETEKLEINIIQIKNLPKKLNFNLYVKVFPKYAVKDLTAKTKSKRDDEIIDDTIILNIPKKIFTHECIIIQISLYYKDTVRKSYGGSVYTCTGLINYTSGSLKDILEDFHAGKPQKVNFIMPLLEKSIYYQIMQGRIDDPIASDFINEARENSSSSDIECRRRDTKNILKKFMNNPNH